jgi:hypothetical protein
MGLEKRSPPYVYLVIKRQWDVVVNDGHGTMTPLCGKLSFLPVKSPSNTFSKSKKATSSHLKSRNTSDNKRYTKNIFIFYLIIYLIQNDSNKIDLNIKKIY